jgi:hypothetical protein
MLRIKPVTTIRRIADLPTLNTPSFDFMKQYDTNVL